MDGTTLYLVGEQALYRSVDNGSEWSELGLSGRITALVESPTKDLWAGFWNGYSGPSPTGDVTAVFRSTDGGVTWQDQLLPSTTGVIYDIAVDPSQPEVVYVGGWLSLSGDRTGVLFKTSDGGSSWQKIFELEGGNVRTIAIDPHDSQQIFLGSELKVHAAGVFWSRDGGQTWTKIHKGGPTKILLNPTDSRVYAAMREVAPGGVYIFTPSEDKTAVHQQSWGLLKRANNRN